MCLVSVVTIRPAGAMDVVRIAEIIHGEPSPETVGLVGDRRLASAFGEGLVELDHIPNSAKPTVVAEIDGRVVGVLQYTIGEGVNVTLAHLRLALRVTGLARLVWSLPRLLARRRVDLPPPSGVFYVAELHVDPALRGQGIGGRLLDWADDEARRIGHRRLALTTYATNEARRLYERHGYRVTKNRDDATYEKYTGTPGRILMEKELA
jgi:GNAT superfamily N-acetyltransferase